jgi:aminoglycoside 6'-N-acetyltransferase I
MDIIVRQMHAGDRVVWAHMRAALWPEDNAVAHAKEVDDLLAGTEAWGFIAETTDGDAAGFTEVAIRKYANGCDSAPVAFLEGVWVKPQYRRHGIGTRLVEHAETFIAARGFRELGSDTQLDNHASQAAHMAWGFSETERVVYFRKIVKPLAGRLS